MGLFKKKAAASVGRKVFGSSKPKSNAPEQLTAKEIAEYKKLKAQAETDAEMRKKWKRYYDTECQGDCDACEYYDWCPEDYADEHEDDEASSPAADAAAPAATAAAVAPAVAAAAVDQPSQESSDHSAADEAEEEEVIELDEEEYAAYCAAVDYYEAGCDGECDSCPHYEWCPAEEEVDEDDKVIIAGITGSQIKGGAVKGMNLAKETAQTAREFKEAIDDITSVFDPRKW